jgi:predicted transcriptional regulator
MMSFAAHVVPVSKGRESSLCFKAILKRDAAASMALEAGDAVLLSVDDNTFPTVITRQYNKSGHFSYAFTVPRSIGVKLSSAAKFELVCKPCLDHTAPKTGISTASVKKTSSGHTIFHFNTPEGTLSWIYSRGCKPVLLPRTVCFRKNGFSLFELAGAFFCEGLRARKENHNLDRLSFSNADKEQVAWFLEACEVLFGLPTSAWKCQVLHPEPNARLIDVWSDAGVNKENITLYRNQTVRTSSGVCIIYISNSTLAEVFYQIYERCLKLAPNDPRTALEFFRGVSRGDIGISKRHITFSTELKEDVELVAKICRALEVTVSKPYFGSGCWNVVITGYQSFKKLLELHAIAHSKRLRQLKERLTKSKKSFVYEYLKSVSEGIVTSRALATSLRLSQVTTTAYLRKWEKEGYLARKQRHGNAFEYKLTREGRRMLVEFERLTK